MSLVASNAVYGYIEYNHETMKVKKYILVITATSILTLSCYHINWLAQHKYMQDMCDNCLNKYL